MNFSFYIAKRYLFSKKSNNAINIITKIASLGVIVGSLALFIVLSVFTGLKSFSAKFLNATDPNIRITSTTGKSFDFSSELQNHIFNTKDVTAFTKVIEERAFFKYKDKEHIAYIKGVDRNYTNVVSLDTLIYTGKWLDHDKNTALIGSGIANKLSVGILNYGEPIQIFVPKPSKKYVASIANAFQREHVQSVGVFSISEDLDYKYVFTPIHVAQRLLNYKKNQVTAIDIKTQTNDTAAAIAQLKEKLGSNFSVKSREEINAVFYKILNTEKLAAYLLFTLVLVIAIFNVIGSIIMMILDKRKNLTTLYNLGATLKEIKQIFIFQGFLMSSGGLLIGTSIGVILIYLQNKFKLFMITSTIAYPIEFKLSNLITVYITIGVLGYIASYIASKKISKNLLN